MAVDRRRSKKVRGLLLGTGCLLACWLMLPLAKLLGVSDFAVSRWLLACSAILIVQGALFVLVQLGWDRRLLGDATFLHLPVLSASLLLDVMLWAAPAVRGPLLMSWFVVLLFAAGRVGYRAVLAWSAFKGAGYLAVVLLIADRIPHLSVAGELFWLSAFAAVCGASALMFERLYRDRGELRDVRRTLAADLADRQRAEEERRQLEARVLESQKLESLGVLAGGIAHDFNNLLVGILGYADLALLDLPEGAPERANVAQIVAAAQKAADLVSKLLAYSGRGKFVVERIELSSFVRELSDLLEISISKKVSLSYRLADQPLLVDADTAQLNQVLMNLIANASDAFAESSGTITVATAAIDADRGQLARFTAEALPPGRYARVEVRDNGCGMDAETCSRIFEPFFTTKFTGRGLGLAAVLGIVRGHHGAIRVDSAPGAGTAVQFLLPLADAADDSEVIAVTGSGDFMLPILTVLVVDDDPTVRAFVTQVLDRIGLGTVAAADGAEAVAIFRGRREKIGAVLLDMMMPVMNGEETFRALQQIDPSVPVILSSGYSEQQAMLPFAGASVAGFLQKPYTSKALTRTIRKIVVAD